MARRSADPRGSRALALVAVLLVVLSSICFIAPAGAQTDPSTETSIPQIPGTETPATGTTGAGTGVREGAAPNGVVDGRGWIVVDAGTGEVLASQDPHTPMLAASTVKTMTALVAIDRLGLDGVVTVSPTIDNVACNCLDGFAAGQQWVVRDLLAAMLVGSENDVAYALAEGASGSVELYARDATVMAQRLGLADSTFADPAGLDGAEGYMGGTLVSAYDLAVLARNAIDIPEIAAIVGATSVTITGPDGAPMVFETHNQLLGGYPGATGFKTGFTSNARSSLIASATRDGRTIITVLLGSEETFDSSSRLLDLGFATPAGSGTGQYLPTVRLGPAAVPFSGARLVSATVDAPTVASSSGGSGGGVGLPSGAFLVIPVVLLGFVVVLRRRAVQRQRRARERHLAFMDARRRGLRVIEPDDL